jgi:uncharacterized integral membrane protein
MSTKASESRGSAGGGTGGARGLLTPTRVAVGALALLALIFIFENTRATRIRLLIPEVTMPLWMALLGTAVIGGLCGACFMRRRR